MRISDGSSDVCSSDLADVALLKQRVALAVKHVCGNANIRNLREVEDMKRCRAEASTRSHNDVELALENARHGTRLASTAGLTVSQYTLCPVIRASQMARFGSAPPASIGRGRVLSSRACLGGCQHTAADADFPTGPQ